MTSRRFVSAAALLPLFATLLSRAVAEPKECSHGVTDRLKCLYEHYDEAPYLDHWLEYAARYEAHFPPPCEPDDTLCEPIKLLEIGVQSGGSTRVWRQFYGARFTYVGLDINPHCKRSEVPQEGTFVEIGSQLDPDFLRSVCEKYGPFDAVIDDGGHTIDMIRTSLETIWPDDSCMKPSSVYAVEDLHVMNGCQASGWCESPSQFLHLVGELFHSMHYYHRYGGLKQLSHQKPHAIWGNRILGVHLYDSLLFMDRGFGQDMHHLKRGNDSIPYTRRD